MEDTILQRFSTGEWILGFLGVYIVVVIALGLFYRRRIHEADDLVVAGRKLSYIFMVPSILATWICAGALMGAAGFAYLFGMQGVIFDPWAPALCMILIAVFFAYRMRQARYTTLTDFFNTRYDERMGHLYTVIQILAALAWLGGQLVALGIIVYLTTGFPMTTAVMIAAAVIVVVSVAGGLWALTRVDAIGFLLIVAGLVVMLPAVMAEVGGFSNFFQVAENWAELPTWAMVPIRGEEGYLWYTGLLGILFYIAAWTALSLGDVPSQVLMQRVLAAKTERTAVAGFFTTGILYLVLGMVPVMIGIAIFTWGLEIPVDQAEFVLPWAAYTFVPAWAGVLFVVALAAAIISTSGDSALTISTLIGHNLYRTFRPQATPQQVLRVVRISIPIVTLFAFGIALYFETVYRLIVLSGGIQLATIVAAYILGFFWKKANVTGAISSFFAGAISWIVGYFVVLPYTKEANMDVLEEGQVYMNWAIEDAAFIALVPAAVISFLTLVVVSLLTQKRTPAKVMRSMTGQDMAPMPKFFWTKAPVEAGTEVRPGRPGGELTRSGPAAR
jgi:solute:Na+ symporter, SSS family